MLFAAGIDFFWQTYLDFDSTTPPSIIVNTVNVLENLLWCTLCCLRPCHTLPDSANGRVTDNKIICPFVCVCMRFLSVPHAVNAFRVR